MTAPWNAEYVVADTLPALPTDDIGLRLLGRVDGAVAEQVARSPRRLGVEGEPVPFDEGAGVSWRVGVRRRIRSEHLGGE